MSKTANSSPMAIRAIDAASVHRICSGQVVVDLSTAVKELVENSLDAKATSIEIRLKDHGASMIEVADNGIGIDEENYQALTLKHWTSKINDFSDLETVSSFGFRGEALSSLCALGKLTVLTMKRGQDFGMKLVYDHDGKLVQQMPAARKEPGTTVTVTDLFYTLPVRRKAFLKSAATEFSKMVTLMQAYACISTGVRFHMSHMASSGGRELLISTDGNAASILDNVTKLYGAKEAEKLEPLSIKDLGEAAVRLNDQILNSQFSSSAGLFPPTSASSDDDKESNTEGGLFSQFAMSKELQHDAIDTTTLAIRARYNPLSGCAVEGYISKMQPKCGRTTADRQFYFVNGRPVELPKIAKAINEVYRQYSVGGGQFTASGYLPIVFLNFTLPPRTFDVNVAPDKRTMFLHQEAHLIEFLRTYLQSKYQTLENQLPANTIRIDQMLTQMTKMTPQSTQMSNADETKSVASADEDKSYDVGKTASNGLETDAASQHFETQESVTPLAPAEEAAMTMGEREPPNVHSAASFVSGSESKTSTGGAVFVEYFGESQSTSRTSSHRRSEDNEGSCNSDFRAQSSRTFGGLQLTIFEGITENPIPNSSDLAESSILDEKLGTKRMRRSAVMNDLGERHENLPNNGECQDHCHELHHEPKTVVAPTYDPPQPPAVEMVTLDSLANHGEETISRTDHAEPTVKLPPRLNPAPETMSKSDAIHQYITTSAPATTVVNVDWNRLGKRFNQLNTQLKQRAQGRQAEENRQNEGGTSLKDGVLPHNGLEFDVKQAESVLSLTVQKDDFLKMEILGQFNLGFIITRLRPSDPSRQSLGHLFIVDQHASDEKYRYELLRAGTPINVQPLLVPQPLRLTKAEEEIIRAYLPLFTLNGFNIQVASSEGAASDEVKEAEWTDTGASDSSETQLKLLSVPYSKGHTFGMDDVAELCQLITNHPHDAQLSLETARRQSGKSAHNAPEDGPLRPILRIPKLDAMFASRACRSAVMIGMPLQHARMEEIVRHMNSMECPWSCPHGRPTMRHLANLDEVTAQLSDLRRRRRLTTER